jgi:hypothetical protein
MSNIYEKLSKERKELQAKGLLPDWYTTAAWQMFKSKYLYDTGKVGCHPVRLCLQIWEPIGVCQ